MTNTKVMTDNIYGDCTKCWQPMWLEIDLKSGEETLVCSNKICKDKVELKHIKFYSK